MSPGSSDSDDDLGDFLDAQTFSFGSDGFEMEAIEGLDDMPLKSGVKFNPMVTIFGGGQIPIAAGDGFWDTLQYESTGLNALGRRSSLSLNDLEDTEGSMSESKLLNDSGSASGSASASMSLGDIASPGDEEGAGGIKEVFFDGGAIYTKGQQFLDYMTSVFKGDSDKDLLVDEDDVKDESADLSNLHGSLKGEESSSSLKGATAALFPNPVSNTAATTSNATRAALTLQ
jgi:hypothetical protein